MTGGDCEAPGDDPIDVDGSTTSLDKIKFQFTDVTKIEVRGRTSLLSGVMVIPPGVGTDKTYGFRIYACDNPGVSIPPATKCNGLQGSYGSYDFIVEVV